MGGAGWWVSGGKRQMRMCVSSAIYARTNKRSGSVSKKVQSLKENVNRMRNGNVNNNNNNNDDVFGLCAKFKKDANERKLYNAQFV